MKKATMPNTLPNHRRITGGEMTDTERLAEIRRRRSELILHKWHFPSPKPIEDVEAWLQQLEEYRLDILSTGGRKRDRLWGFHDIVAAELPRLIRQVHKDASLIAEIRRRAITDFWDGTGPTARRWWVCRVCEWKEPDGTHGIPASWRDGQPEAHEPSCPLRGTTR